MKKYRHSVCCLYAICVVFASTARAEYFPGVDAYIDTDISPPLFPTSVEDCAEYSKEAEEIIREIHEAHEKCLKDAPPRRHKGNCSKAACEGLHNARSELRRQKSVNGAECRSAVQAQKVIQKSMKSSSSSRSTRTPRTSPNKVGVAVRQTVRDAKNIHETCEAISSLKERKECYGAVHDYSDHTRALVPTSPVVKGIQDESSTHLRDHNRRLLEDMDTVRSELESIGSEENRGGNDGGWSQEW